MATGKSETLLDPEDYVRSLLMPDEQGERSVRVQHYDGAALYAVAEDHFLVLCCTQHKHRGHEYVAKVLPSSWECFAQVTNADEGFAAYHYGPES